MSDSDYIKKIVNGFDISRFATFCEFFLFQTRLYNLKYKVYMLNSSKRETLVSLYALNFGIRVTSCKKQPFFEV